MVDKDQTQKNLELARAYILFQELDQIYNLREGLKRGSLFPELYMPYEMNTGSSGGAYYG
ncbi:spore coat associated protein CotJA [Tissierella creatinini]|nr:spore coat associated protein CotJA [Tissierella creatinini]TJX66042.1 spore coat associated protein CotJA [Soehngenia saccharolytica]